MAADHAREDSDIAQATAKQFAPDFKQPGLERLKTREPYRIKTVPEEQLPLKSILQHTQQNDITANQIPNQVPSHNPTTLPQKPQQQQLHQQQQQQSLYNKKPPEMNQINQINQMNQMNQIPNQIPPPTNITNLTNLSNQNIDQTDQNQNHQDIRSQNQLQKSNSEINRIPNSNQEITIPINNPTNPSIRRGSKLMNEKPSLLNSQQPSIDHFDHYKRPPSRDSSVDRYSRATGRMGMGSRQPSVDKTSVEVSMDARSVRGPSAARGTTPMPAGNGSVLTGSGVNR